MVTYENITERKNTEKNWQAFRRMLEAIQQVRSDFIAELPPQKLFDNLLRRLLGLAKSEYGVIGEVLCQETGNPYLKTQAITNIAWNEATKKFYAISAPEDMDFYDLKTLFG